MNFYFTKNPNLKNFFFLIFVGGGGVGLVGRGSRLSEFLLLRIQI